MKKYLFPILMIIVVLLAACSKATPQPTQPPTTAPVTAPAKPTAEENVKESAASGAAWETIDCSTFDIPAEVVTQADCGYVTVPENRAVNNDKTIKLAVVRVRSTSDQPGTPVIEGTGGPGAAGLGGAANILNESAGILADRDWVFFSQRGTQFAQPWLDCPAYNGMPREAAKNGWSLDEQVAHEKEAIQGCVDDFKAQGVDLTGYNSVQNAEDINAIRQALGYDKIIYYGQSYGTLLGQYLMRIHPEIVEAIILDGIAPASAERWTEVTDFAVAFRNVFEACAKDEACHAAYPDPESALVKGLESLKTNPPSMEIDAGNGQKETVNASESLVMNTLFLLLYVKNDLLPAAVYQFSQGDMTLLSQLAPLALGGDIARVQHLAMVCSDDPVKSLEEVNLDSLPEIYRGLVRYDAMSYVNGCAMLNLPQLPGSSDELIQSDIPALLLQGGLDPATPVKAGNLVEPGFENSYNVIFPAGADIQLHSPCAQSIMKAFMNDPQTAPDTSCVDPTIPFTITQGQAAPAATPAPASFGPTWESVNCSTFELPEAVAGVSDCGYVTVPAKHEEPDGPTIQLAVVRVRSTGENPASDPLIMEQGGPGGSTVGLFPGFLTGKPSIAPLLDTRDIIFVEQRGTEFSKPFLSMPEQDEYEVALAAGKAAEGDYSYVTEYAERIQAEGVDLTAFTSKQNAADMYSVVDALGYDQFNYYGVSYGTLLGQYVLYQAKDHPGMLRSVILDSVVPMDYDEDSTKDAAASSAIRAFFAACAADAACSMDFPDLERKVLAKADELNAVPAEITLTLPDGSQVKNEFTGYDLTRMIFDTLYNVDLIKQLPGHLDEVVNRDYYAWVESVKSDELSPSTMAEAMHLSMKCPRFKNFPGTPPVLFEPAYPQVQIAAPEMAAYQARCDLLPLASSGTDEYIYSNENIPTLVLSGALDPATPPAQGKYVAERLKMAYNYVFPDVGHGVLSSAATACPGAMAQAFLADPNAAPDGSCVQDLKPFFYGRVTPVDELTLKETTVVEGVTAKVPEQWTQANALFYDANDPISAATGVLNFGVVDGESAQKVIDANLKNNKVIAVDQQIGNFQWTIAEGETSMANRPTRVRMAATVLPGGKVLLVRLIAPVGTASAVFKALWEPVVSSVSVAAK